MSNNIVFEGWLTKSPPSKRIWRTKWRRRWFALRQSGELPGQYFLDYYADRNCRRLKGTINLNLCEQVDAGLHMARAGNGTLDPKLRGSVFTIQTQSRTYHLEADCEADMENWVNAICRVCGLRPAEDDSNETYQNSANVSRANANSDNVVTTGPYIAISDCITGVRNQEQQTTFTFEPDTILPSTQKTTCDKATETCQRIYVPPQIKVTCVESENESNLSDEDSKSLNTSQSNIPDWSVTKTFTKLAVSPKKVENIDDGPPVPPRPPKTFAKKKEVQKETFQGPKIQEPVDPVQESIANYTGPGTPWLRVPRRVSYSPVPQSPGRQYTRPYFTVRHNDDDEFNPGIRLPLSFIRRPLGKGPWQPGINSTQYCNMPSLPPAVDRALKPRYSSHSIGHINNYMAQRRQYKTRHDIFDKDDPEYIHPQYNIWRNNDDIDNAEYVDDVKPETLQYLDLDLQSCAPNFRNAGYPQRLDIIHGKSYSGVESECVYKTVDFLKTEAFNMTRQDAEASRSHQY